MNLLSPESLVLGGSGKISKGIKTSKNSFNPFSAPPPARHVWPKKKLLNKQRQELKRVCCISPDDGQLGGNEKEIFCEIAQRPIVVSSRKISQIIYGFCTKKCKNISNFSLVRCKLAAGGVRRACLLFVVLNFWSISPFFTGVDFIRAKNHAILSMPQSSGDDVCRFRSLLGSALLFRLLRKRKCINIHRH